MLRFLTAGESHGPALTVIVEGLPSGIPIVADDLAGELARRRLGYGRGPRMAIEQDELELLGGIRHGHTIGSPVAIVIRNTEWYKWNEEMSPAPGEPKRRLTQPRPGHADLVGMQKYGFDDARNILERASARETAARVVAGTLAKALLRTLDIDVFSHVVRIGAAAVADGAAQPTAADLARIDASPVRSADATAEAEMIAAIEDAKANKETLGGTFEVITTGLPVGLGSHVHWDRKLDGRLAQAIVSIQAVKGCEIGDAAANAARPGSQAHDEITYDADGYHRTSGRAGGLEGGITTGEPLVVRGFMKPISTLPKGLQTVDVDTKAATTAFYERSDVVAVPAAGVVGEAMVALVLADAVLETFGGDTVDDLRGAVDARNTRIAEA